MTDALYKLEYIDNKISYIKLKMMQKGGTINKVRKFINELGNKITIKIKNHKDNGINYETKKKIKFDGVNISIIGPSSMTENVITYKEAEELYYILKKFLKK